MTDQEQSMGERLLALENELDATKNTVALMLKCMIDNNIVDLTTFIHSVIWYDGRQPKGDTSSRNVHVAVEIAERIGAMRDASDDN